MCPFFLYADVRVYAADTDIPGVLFSGVCVEVVVFRGSDSDVCVVAAVVVDCVWVGVALML